MVRGVRGSQIEEVGEFARRFGTGSQGQEDPQPAGVGKATEELRFDGEWHRRSTHSALEGSDRGHWLTHWYAVGQSAALGQAASVSV